MNSSNLKAFCHRNQSYIAPITVSLITILLLGIFSLRFYHFVKSPNISLKGKASTYLYIPTGTDFKGLLGIIKRRGILKNEKSFIFVSARKHYDARVKAGKYMLRAGMSNNELVNLLRSGKQVPVRLNIQSARSVAELAGKLSHQVEADSASLMKLFNDPLYLQQFGIDPDNVFVLFLPNTYEIFWNTSATQLVWKMSLEQKSFWNSIRRQQLSATGLDIKQVVTIASIVDKETNKDSEKPDIAGVYINRLHKGWPLQADPTVIYACGDYSIRRLSSQFLKTESRYNTYLHTGLPPGPICIPSVSSIDAVLNFRNHKYMYFCAKDDLSGYHNFAMSLTEHLHNAKNYQKALDNLNIK
jgi:UPF0755 protein